ncbi:hypothetical protein M0R89_04435 [Halorussus limi]|uniref:Uncharacterized protein n=1 Tax=Halorussus limi TaxID=2938695 RepID=A0A8U0HWL8_9EURY|nr:hypothetical protein [Halorussus limi]UPV75317.1 hypothetical protein M0R89_04435 [Halorussus limi]
MANFEDEIEEIPPVVTLENFGRTVNLPQLLTDTSAHIEYLSELYGVFTEFEDSLESPSPLVRHLYRRTKYSSKQFTRVVEALEAHIEDIELVMGEYEVNDEINEEVIWSGEKFEGLQSRVRDNVSFSEFGEQGFRNFLDLIRVGLLQSESIPTGEFTLAEILTIYSSLLENIRRGYIEWELGDDTFQYDGGRIPIWEYLSIALILAVGIYFIIAGFIASSVSLYAIGVSVIVGFYFHARSEWVNSSPNIQPTSPAIRATLQGRESDSVVITPKGGCSLSFIQINNAFGYPRVAENPQYLALYSRDTQRVQHFGKIKDILNPSEVDLEYTLDGYGSPENGGKVLNLVENSFRLLKPTIGRGNTRLTSHRYTDLGKLKNAATLDDLF